MGDSLVPTPKAAPKGKDIIQAILDGEMTAPEVLDALKDFRTKEASEMEDHVSVVGMRHQAHADFLKVKKNGTAVLFVPDPANPYDGDAIACYVTMPTGDGDRDYSWIRAGYVARNQTHLLRHRQAVYEGKIYRKSHDFWSVTADQYRVF